MIGTAILTEKLPRSGGPVDFLRCFVQFLILDTLKPRLKHLGLGDEWYRSLADLTVHQRFVGRNF